MAYGRFGIYIKYNDENFRIPTGVSPDEITQQQALDIVEGTAKKQAAIKTFANGAELLEGRYGLYIKYNGKNYKIDKGLDAQNLSDEQVLQIISKPHTTKKRTK